MANIVEFLVKMRDMVSGPMQKMAGTGGNAFQKLENSVNKVTGRTGVLKMSISQIDAALNNLSKTRSISLDDRQIKRINKEMDALERRKNRLEGSGGSILGGFGGYLGIAGLGFLGNNLIEKGIGRQINKTVFETMAGKAAGDQLNQDLIDYATKSIYGNEVVEEGKLMIGSGVKAKNIMHIERMLGDLAAGSTERMKSLALAFSEASSTGFLTGRQELMMRTALFNPLESLSKITGKPGAELKKDMEKGKIGIDLLVRAMEYATGPMGRWHNLEDNISKQGAGQWIAFKGALSTLAGTIGQALMPALGKVANFLNYLVSNKRVLYDIAIGIGAMTIAWGAYTVAAKVAAIAAEGLTLWEIALEAFTSPWMVAAGVGVLSAAIGGLILNHIDLGDKANPVLDNITKKTDQYGNSATIAANKFTTAADKIVDANGRMARSSQNLPTGLAKTLGDFEDQMRLKKRLEDIANSRALAFMNKHGGKISELDILRIKRDVGVPGYGATANDMGSGGSAITGDIGGNDTSAAITGGGVRNITINVAKFQDKTEIHTATMKEGAQQIEEMFRDMFLRIVNSGAAALN